MASSSQNGNGIIAGINVTPLVDITLVLLIIFIVTAKIIVTPAVPLDLPRASQSEELQVVFSVIVPVTGPTLVNGEPATTDDVLLRLAKEALVQRPRRAGGHQRGWCRAASSRHPHPRPDQHCRNRTGCLRRASAGGRCKV